MRLLINIISLRSKRLHVMRKIKLLSLGLVLATAAVFLSNCGTGGGTDPKPTLEFAANQGFVFQDISLAGDEDFTVGIRASHTENIVSFKVTVSYNGGPALEPAECAACDSTFSSKDFDYDYVGHTAAAAGSEVWTFTVADNKGNESSKSITITNLGTGGASLIEIEQDNNSNTLKVWNFQGVNSGAFDLVVGSNLLSADDNADKDIQDSCTVAEVTNWPGRWTSRNGTTFKKMSTYNWGNVTNTSQLDAAWDDVAGSGDAVITVAKGDVYVAKLRGSSDNYVLIEITDVVKTGADNNDYVQFRYKKKP